MTAFSMPKEAKMQRKHKSAVNNTMEILKPATPMMYLMSKAGIHRYSSTNWKPGLALSKIAKSQIAMSSGGSVAAAETQRMSLALLGSASTNAAPATGIKV